MSSHSPSAGLNPLIAADSHVIKDQQRSFSNPDISGKSLNTKEFSDVLDDQHAQQKVSGGSKISDAVKDQPNRDENSTKTSTTTGDQKKTDVAVEAGNILPLSEEFLPQEITSPDSLLNGVNGNRAEGEFASEWILANSDNVSDASNLEKALNASSAGAQNNEEAVPQLQPKEVNAASVTAAASIDVKNSAANNTESAQVAATTVVSSAVATTASKQAARLEEPTHALASNKEASERAAGVSKPISTVNQQPADSTLMSNMAASSASANPIVNSAIPFKVQAEGLAKGLTDKVQFESLLASAGDSSKTPKDTTVSSSWSMTDASQVYKTAAQSIVSPSAAVPMNKPGFSEAVMQKVMWMSSQQINKAEISLDPPELGSLQVRVSSHGDQTSVVFSSQHGSVRDALDQNLPRLREMLEQQGLNLADVNVADQGAQQQRSDSEPGSLVSDSRANNGHDDNFEQPVVEPAESLSKTLSLVDHYV